MVEKISPPALAARLREAIDLSAKSQKELADLFVISEAAVSKWLRTGKVGRDRLPIIAHFLGVSLTWLASGEGPIRVPSAEYITEDERRLLKNYRKLDEAGKQTAQTVIERFGSGLPRLPTHPGTVLIQPSTPHEARRTA